jgi:hypothetical protein
MRVAMAIKWPRAKLDLLTLTRAGGTGMSLA